MVSMSSTVRTLLETRVVWTAPLLTSLQEVWVWTGRWSFTIRARVTFTTQCKDKPIAWRCFAFEPQFCVYLTRIDPGEVHVLLWLPQSRAGYIDIVSTSHRLWRHFKTHVRRTTRNCQWDDSIGISSLYYYWTAMDLYLPRRAADIWWRSEGFPWSRPCSRRPPDALCLDSAAQIPWWGHRSPACYWLWSPLEELPCAGTPWPGGWSHDREPQQAGLAADRWSQSGWRRGRRGCHCLLWGSERCVLLLLLGSFSGINPKLWITWEVDVGHIGAFMVPVTLRTITHYDPAAVGTRVSSRGRRQDQLTVFVSVFNAAGGRKKHGRRSDSQRSRTADASNQHLRRESLKVSR